MNYLVIMDKLLRTGHSERKLLKPTSKSFQWNELVVELEIPAFLFISHCCGLGILGLSFPTCEMNGLDGKVP